MYYIIINERQQGPFPREELLQHGLTPSTMVWRAGMDDWMPASQVAELQALFSAGGQPAPRSELNQSTDVPAGQQQWRQPYRQPAGYTPHTNWMPWAIVCTVLGLCSCIGLVLGIIAISKASTANKAFMAGDAFSGNAANNTAKILTIIGLVFDGIGILVNLSLANLSLVDISWCNAL